jgi:hypothetical protein
MMFENGDVARFAHATRVSMVSSAERAQVVGAPVQSAPGRVAGIDQRLQRTVGHRLHQVGRGSHGAAQAIQQSLAARVLAEPGHDDAECRLEAQRLRHERCRRRHQKDEATAEFPAAHRAAGPRYARHTAAASTRA